MEVNFASNAGGDGVLALRLVRWLNIASSPLVLALVRLVRSLVRCGAGDDPAPEHEAAS